MVAGGKYRDESCGNFEDLIREGLGWFGLLGGAFSEQPIENTHLSRSVLTQLSGYEGMLPRVWRRYG